MAKLDGDWIYLSEDELSNVKGISKGRQKELIHMAINEPALTEFNISSYMGHFKMIMHFKLMEKQKLMDDEIDSFATADKYEKMLIEDEFEVGLKATFYIFKDGFYMPVATSIKYILVAYWFKHDYQRIVARLNQIGVKYMKIDSDESITKWNNREIPVALIHPASAGHGLNLQQGGNTMVWFGITWSLELYQQCVCRLYRQGQTEGTVTIIHLISQGTIDEKIMKALSEKDNTQASLIDAVKAEI